MGIPGGWELVLIVGVLVLLFGATKLPQMARSLGQSARVFKAEARGMKQDEEAAKKDGSKEEPQQLTAGEASAPVNASSQEEAQRKDSKN